jgi:RNA polymerase sigma-70 factor, ECF subfamily
MPFVSVAMQVSMIPRPSSPWSHAEFIGRGVVMRSDDGKKADPRYLLAAIAATQDRAAFADLFEFYAPRIKSMLMRGGATPDTAEDIAQETLITVWHKAGYFDPARASASAWVYTIARNLRVDRLRRDRLAALYASEADVPVEEPDRPDQLLHAAERADRVKTAIKELPEEQARVLKLSFFENRAHADIAEDLGLPLGTVKSRLRLALARLRGLLGELS